MTKASDFFQSGFLHPLVRLQYLPMTSVGVPTFETWRRFEGQIVNGEFQLHKYLGGTDYAGVFLTQRNLKEKAAIKLVPEDPQYAELQLARWRMAEELTHPHLLRIFGSGRCELDGRRYLYVLMEYADENLAHILPHRALTETEIRDMLQPLAETLRFLHDKGIVHGHVKPSNIMAVDDELKFSSDGLSTEPDSGERPERRTAYEAPEAYGAALSPASDVWSIGMTLVEVATQRLPTRSGAELIATGLPAPFGEIARNCLRIDPHQRWSIPGILARLEGPPASPPVQMSSKVAEMPARTTTTPSAAPPVKHNLLTRYLVAIAVALIVIAIAAVTRKRNEPQAHRGAASQVSAPSSPSRPAETPPPSAAPAPSAQAPAKAAAAAPSKPQPTATSHREKGAVAHQVLPNVSESARQTVTGHLKVAVRVSVNVSGDVVNERYRISRAKQVFFAPVDGSGARMEVQAATSRGSERSQRVGLAI